MTSHPTRNAPAEAPLPRPPGALRRLLARRPMLVDGTIAGGYLFGCLLMTIVDVSLAPTAARHEYFGTQIVDESGAPWYLAFPWLLVFLAKVGVVFFALLWRRKYPLPALIVVALVVAAADPTYSQIVADGTALVFALYAVPLHGSVAKGWIAYGVAVAASAVNPTGYTVPDVFGEIISMAVFLLLVLVVGINVGNRRRYVAALVDRAEHLTREREQLARIAVAEERERIAREMHDIVAHSLSVMVTLSEGAARTVETDPHKARSAMERSAETGRSALTEMRRLLGVLSDRDSGRTDVAAHLAPQPDAKDLPRLVQDVRETGIDVTLTTRGRAPDDQGFALALYRIVQESLTNVLRHAGVGARAEVTIDHGVRATTVLVRDFGAAGLTEESSTSRLGSGSGLTGLNERVRVFGGTFDAEPAPGGGWQVTATLPRPDARYAVTEHNGGDNHEK